jgi:zinc/manganese transport system ATP-binding protein
VSGHALEVTAAAVSLGGRTIWADVDVVIEPGQFVAILGPNGVGKSTLIKAVLGLLPLSAGEIRVFGGPAGPARRHIGYLPQRRSFDAGLHIRGVDVVRLGLDGARWGLPLPGRLSRSRHEDARRVDEAIEVVGACAYAGRPIGQCSGGEQQRLLIAQALIRRPRMLLLDEPLDSLDLPNQAAVAALIADVSTSQSVTVLMVAHDVNPILTHLDQVVYLGRSGAVSGTVDQVITGETLTKLYQTPIEVLRASDGRLVVVGQPEAPHLHSDRHGGGGH